MYGGIATGFPITIAMNQTGRWTSFCFRTHRGTGRSVSSFGSLPLASHPGDGFHRVRTSSCVESSSQARMNRAPAGFGGMRVMELLMEEEVRERVGERSQPQPDRTANRWGKERGFCVVMG